MQKNSMVAALSNAEKHALIGDSTILLLLLLLAPLPSQGPAYQDQEFGAAAVYATEVQFNRGRGLSRAAQIP